MEIILFILFSLSFILSSYLYINTINPKKEKKYLFILVSVLLYILFIHKYLALIFGG